MDNVASEIVVVQERHRYPVKPLIMGLEQLFYYVTSVGHTSIRHTWAPELNTRASQIYKYFAWRPYNVASDVVEAWNFNGYTQKWRYG